MLRSGAWMVTATLALAGCGGGGGGGTTDPAEAMARYAGPIDSTDVERGEELFNSVCMSCHGGGAPALENIGWEPAAMRQRVREGGGNMPAISESRLSAPDLEAILAYLLTIGGVVGDTVPLQEEHPAPFPGDDAPAEE